MEPKAAPKGFDPSQEMTKKSLELRYCLDLKLPRVELHAHPFYEIYYFLEGPVESYVVGGKSYSLMPGDILMLPPGVPHHPVFRKGSAPYRRYVLWLSEGTLKQMREMDPELFEAVRVCGESGTYRIRCALPAVRQQMETYLSTMWQEEQSTACCKHGYLYSLCVNFLVLLNRLMADEHTLIAQKYHSDQLLDKIIAYIHENYTRPITLNEVAEQFFTSPSSIEQLLKKRLGKPFYRYVTDCRIIHAQTLIAKGIPLKEVGLACGYNDYSNFYRAFSRVVGTPPSQYHKHFPMDHFQGTPITETT